MVLCWLCKSTEADTAEHLIQAAVINKLMFVDNTSPIYLKRWQEIYKNGNKERIQVRKKLQSHNSKFLKPYKNLCKFCNNQRTQTFDKANKIFFTFLKSKQFYIEINKQIDFTKIRANEGEVYRSFVKFFCCILDATRTINELPTLTPPPNLIRCLNRQNYINKNLFIKFFTNGKPITYPLGSNILITDPEYVECVNNSYSFSFLLCFGWLEIYFYFFHSNNKEIINLIFDQYEKDSWFGASKIIKIIR